MKMGKTPDRFDAFCSMVLRVLNQERDAEEQLTWWMICHSDIQGAPAGSGVYARYYDHLFDMAAQRWIQSTEHQMLKCRKTSVRDTAEYRTALDCVRMAFLNPEVRGMARECLRDVCNETQQRGVKLMPLSDAALGKRFLDL